MNEIFTPVFIADLKEYIGGVLAKTFKGMFDFDISPINALGRLDNTGEVSAYIELTINNTPTSLCFSIPKSILRDLQHAIHADHLSEETMGLDLTLEIANVVGNGINNFLKEECRLKASIGMPKVGHGSPALSEGIFLRFAPPTKAQLHCTLILPIEDQPPRVATTYS